MHDRAIQYGPFSVDVTALAIAIVSMVVTPVFVAIGIGVWNVRCERASAVLCRVQLRRGAEFGPAFALDRVTTTKRFVRPSKGTPHWEGRLILHASNGARYSSSETALEAVESAEARLQHFLPDDQARVIEIELVNRYWPFLLALVFLGTAGFMGKSALRGAGRAKLSLDDSGRCLLVERSFLGIPLSRRSLELAGVHGVDIEWKQIASPAQRGSHAREHVGRLRLLTNNLGGVPVLTSFARGHSVHVRAATQLRALLGLPPAENTAIPERPVGYDWSSGAGRFAACWVGMCTGSVVGIAIGAGLALTVGGAKLSDSAGGPFYFGGMALGVAGGIALALYLTSAERLNR